MSCYRSFQDLKVPGVKTNKSAEFEVQILNGSNWTGAFLEESFSSKSLVLISLPLCNAGAEVSEPDLVSQVIFDQLWLSADILPPKKLSVNNSGRSMFL